MWHQILAVIGVVALVWFFFWYKKNNPEVFSRQNLSKSFTTMGIIGLGLIAFVAILVVITRHTA